jgi:hypothetical protein
MNRVGVEKFQILESKGPSKIQTFFKGFMYRIETDILEITPIETGNISCKRAYGLENETR